MQEYSKEYIEDLYIKQDISRTELITLLDSNLNSVKKLLKNYNISKSNYKQRGKKSAKTQKENYKKKSKSDKNKVAKKRKKQSSSKKHKQLLSQINKDYQEYLDSDTKTKRNKARSNAVKTAWKDKTFRDNWHKIRKKKRQARKKQLCRTVIEQKAYNILIKRYPDLIYDEKIDDRYPYYVDFYVPSLDLFIELNAHPSHGKAPYKLGENINITGSWLDTCVRRDPEKLKIAKKNKLNYIMVYPANTLENNLKLNKKWKELTKLIYEACK